MWKQLLDMIWRALRLAEDTRQNRQDIKALEKRLFDFAVAAEAENLHLKRANETLAFEVKRLNDEVQRQRERGRSRAQDFETRTRKPPASTRTRSASCPIGSAARASSGCSHARRSGRQTLNRQRQHLGAG